MKKMSDFIGLYPINKTLRFELKPIGRKLEEIIESVIIKSDIRKAEEYVEAKKIIDDFHKHFMELSLSDVQDEGLNSLLREFKQIYDKYSSASSKNDKKSELDKVRDKLRVKLVELLTKPKNERCKAIYNNLFKKELIEKILPEWVKTEEEKRILESFKGYTTYFSGFHENRKNIYTSKPLSTSIGYRLVHQNLPKFIDNIHIYKKVKDAFGNDINKTGEPFFEMLGVDSLDKVFCIEYYVKVLSQKGIEQYNALIGKIVDEQGNENKGLNEHINRYNQKQSEKGNKLSKFNQLYKQILSDREQLSWLPKTFEDDAELLEAIKNFYSQMNEYSVFELSEKLMKNISDYDTSKIYVRNDTQLTDISNFLFGDWNTINLARSTKYDKEHSNKIKRASYEDIKRKELDRIKSLSIDDINSCIRENTDYIEFSLQSYFSDLQNKKSLESNCNIIELIYKSYSEFEDSIKNVTNKTNIKQDDDIVDKIKALSDSVLSLYRFMKPLMGSGVESDKDERFYTELNDIMDLLSQVIPLYNMVRSYLTSKPYSLEKIKLNFGNQQLLSGWDKNKETNNTAIILRKEGKFYLAIMNKKYNKSFDKKLPTDGECYEKMEYKFFPDLDKNLPRCTTQLKEVVTHFGNSDEPYVLNDKKKFTSPLTITREIYDLNNVKYGDKKYKKIKKGYLLDNEHDREGFERAVKSWITFSLDFLKKYQSTTHYDLSSLRPIEEYKSIDDFYLDVNKLLYQITFQNVSVEHINSLVNDGKLYLFQIYNKDFSEHTKGTPNLHTLYWKMVFDERNMEDIVYKLDGGAEMFFRKSSLEYKETHPANVPIPTKSKGYKNKESKFDYPIVKDERYTKDKFQFHVPITINFNNKGIERINDSVHEFIRENKDVRVIGIDRGERNLLYFSVIDSKGNIIDQGSLNTINNIDYHALLEERSKMRDRERKGWKTIEGIKDLKKGYLSLVVHNIVNLMIKHNAVLSLESLNMAFKQGRKKVESSVYQQFEKQLIDKLNFVADKKAEADEDGGLLRAYQLANKFESFSKMGNQNGFIFYVPAAYTSNIDPVTGFVNLLNVKYKSIEESKKLLDKFEEVRYNKEKDWFEFTFDYREFTSKANDTQTRWKLCTVGNRIYTVKKSSNNKLWEKKDIKLTKAFKVLFKRHKLDYTNGDLKQKIMSKDDKAFYERLLCLLRLTLQLRNSNKDTGEDYIASPVADKEGKFFVSNPLNKELPENADANGAYNIALKGLLMLRRIRECKAGERPNLSIDNKSWFNFLQEKPYLKD